MIGLFHFTVLSVVQTLCTRRHTIGRINNYFIYDVEGSCRELTSLAFVGGLDENHEKPQLIWQVSGLRFEIGNSRIRRRMAIHLPVTFGNIVSNSV
jgi:hypothetical protein